MRTIALLLLLAGSACAQSADATHPIAKGDWNVAILATGGHSVAGSELDTGVMTGGLHFGKVLTSDHGPGFLRGKFELAGEVTPVNLLIQDGDAAYGFGLTPLLFRWNFTSSQKVAPYLELGAGMLWTSDEVPPGSTNFNFTPQAAFGLQFLRDEKKAVSLGVRYMHISNGGRVSPNPGINTLQVTLGFHWFK